MFSNLPDCARVFRLVYKETKDSHEVLVPPPTTFCLDWSLGANLKFFLWPPLVYVSLVSKNNLVIR